jgi:RNA polymerase sigma-70 factor (ECF subfamily)
MADDKIVWVDRLFAEHGGHIKRFFLRRVSRREDAEELAQEVFQRLLRVPDTSMILKPQAYLYTVANNLLREYRSQERRERGSYDLDDPAVQEELADLPGFGGEVDLERRKKVLLGLLRDLPPKCQAVIVMHYFHDMTYEEIAARLEISPHMVKKYVTRALKHFRLHMAGWR